MIGAESADTVACLRLIYDRFTDSFDIADLNCSETASGSAGRWRSPLRYTSSTRGSALSSGASAANVSYQSIRVPWHISTGNILVTRDAACVGLGIALLPDYLADAPIAEGSLVRILPESRLDQAEATALWARSVTPSVAVRALPNHLS